MKSTSEFQVVILAFSLMAGSSSCLVAEEVASTATEPMLQQAVSDGVKGEKSADSIEACWAKWKKAQGLEDGKNELNGHLILVSHQQQAVNAEIGSRSWLSLRNAAFDIAELHARAELASTISTTITSNRSLAISQLGGDDAAPSLKPIVDQLSIADKANVLVGKALDNEISKYDPKWNTKASETDKKAAVATLQSRVQKNIAASAELFAAGGFTAAQCEGKSTDDNGKYSVLVGMIWSPKLAKVAEAIWNPAYTIPNEPPQQALRAQFEQFDSDDPTWLSVTLGARVFTNEKGERVIVGFGSVPQSSMMSADKSRANLEALAAIQRFVGEKVEANRQIGGSIESRDFGEESTKTFDTNAFQEQIRARSQDLHLAGAAEIQSWRGVHPWSNAKMQVVAVAWTQAWAADSRKTGEMMNSVEHRLSGQGAVPASQTTQGHVYRGQGSAAPVHSGASSSAKDF